jgi:PQQ-like domain
MLAAVNKSGMFELYDVGSIDYGPIQDIAMSIPTDKGDFVGVPAFDPVTGYVYVGLPATEGIYRPGLAAFSIQGSTCTLNPTPVWNAQFGPDGAHVSAQTPRSPLSIANGVVYVANYGHKTEFAFDAATGAQLWSDPLSDFGDVGTVIANGIVYVSARDGTITAWAPPGSKNKKRKFRQAR